MKKLVLTALFSAAMLSSTAIYAKDIVIGVQLFSFADKFQTYLQDEIRKFDNLHSDVTFRFADANNDPARLLNDTETFIDQKVDALLVVPTDQKIIKAIGRKAQRAGIPLIILNRRPMPEDMQYVASYVGSDEIEGGRIQGEFIAKAVNGKPVNSVILMGTLGLDATIARTQGNKEVFAKHDNIHVLTEQEAKWDRAKGLEVAENLLAAYKTKGVNVIVSNNDEMAIGAVLASRKLGIKDEDILIVGLDATPDALEYLGNGLDATVYQSAVGQGAEGARIAYSAAKGENVPQIHYVPFELVTPDKKAEYQAKWH
ncbi:substrate-binding domain-containing protein [Conservatibacter flavescens]|uniref:ATPase n=1 Tax=Conservatibacter flavescens TaxID=28161 RepID=A0A2M8S522_9PAST|nr:substrate-binding domain-containing protein [Conservatibacter flavescens]PJG86237.1 ATPase [Conservatibacter flavescens]